MMNTLACAVDVTVHGAGLTTIDPHSTSLMTPLPHRTLLVTTSCPVNCAGRVMKKHVVKQELKTVAGMVRDKYYYLDYSLQSI